VLWHKLQHVVQLTKPLLPTACYVQIFGGGDACSGINWPEIDLLLLGFYDGVGILRRRKKI
jgi:hypothetical protein